MLHDRKVRDVLSEIQTRNISHSIVQETFMYGQTVLIPFNVNNIYISVATITMIYHHGIPTRVTSSRDNHLFIAQDSGNLLVANN